jgi:hypothetical protein
MVRLLQRYMQGILNTIHSSLFVQKYLDLNYVLLLLEINFVILMCLVSSDTVKFSLSFTRYTFNFLKSQ